MSVSFFLRKSLLFCSLVFYTSCCISLPRQKQIENIRPPPPLDESLASSLETPYFSLGPWPDREWWKMFNAPLLDSLMAQALNQNPNLLSVRQKVIYAMQEAIIARSWFYPSLYFRGVDTWEHLSKYGLYKTLNPNIPSNANLVELHFVLNYEFDFWGKYAHLFYAALGREMAQAAEVAQVELVVTTALATAYFALKINLARKYLYERLIDVRTQALTLQNLLLKNALASTFLPLITQEDVLEAKKQLSMIEASILENKHLINVLAGWGPDCCLAICSDVVQVPECVPLPCDLSLELLARRPDLMAQIWSAKALAEEVGAAMTEFYPNVNLLAFAGLESLLISRLFTPNAASLEVRPALSLPLFTAGRIRARVRSKKALFDEAVFAYNALLLKSAQEVADLLAVAKAIYQQREDQQLILNNARQRYDLSVLRRQKKLDSLLNNYRLEDEWILKQLEDVRILFAQYEVIIKLIKALGGGYCVDEIPLQSGCACSS